MENIFNSNVGGPPGIGINPRMNPPRGPSIGGPIGPGGYNPGMRGPPPGKHHSKFLEVFMYTNYMEERRIKLYS